MSNSKKEILAPAGELDSLHAAVMFGADAVYLGGTQFGMRSAATGFDRDTLPRAVEFAHSNNVRVYLTCNIIPRPADFDHLPGFLADACAAGVDGLIIADLGILALARQYAPGVPLHISTQAGATNAAAARAFYNLGARRVVLARELTLSEIAAIRADIPDDLELEVFVHGAMCVSFSGRCLLSAYMNSRDANRGDCSQPCRWKYALMEEKRPGEYYPISEDETGSHILNARDLCLIDHLPALIDAGVNSFKIEGRAKSSYYTAVVTNAYRQALSLYQGGCECLPEWIHEELFKISHRPYSTGFLLGDQPGQTYENGGYIRDYSAVGMVTDWSDGWLTLQLRTRFFVGDTLDILRPNEKPLLLPVTDIRNTDGESVEAAPNAMAFFRVPCHDPVPIGSWARRRCYSLTSQN